MDWKQIWKKKARQHTPNDLSLEEILRVNGYDVKYAETDTRTIRRYVAGLIEKLGLEAGDHLLEVGCGAGAIALPMVENGIRVTGLDICEELIEIAKKAMPDQEFLVAEAGNFDLEKKDFNAALSQGVFQFFDSEEYGIAAFLNMLDHVQPGGMVAVTDLLDKANERELMEERIRLLGEEEYRKKYVEPGLVHQFYHRDRFEDAAKGKCAKVWIERQFLENATASYKFNVFAVR